MNHFFSARSWAAKSLASLLAGFVLAFSMPMMAFAQAASAPAMPPAASAATGAAAAVVTEEAVDNPYGLKALWGQGDYVAKTTLVILAIMSMGSWYVIFTKLFDQRAPCSRARQARLTPSGKPARCRPA